MCDLVASYGLLERYAEALVLEEQVLEIRRRVLPEDHSDFSEFAGL